MHGGAVEGPTVRPYDWREHWQPFAIGLAACTAFVLGAVLTMFAVEWARVTWGH